MGMIGNTPYQGIIQSGSIQDGAITAAKLASGAVPTPTPAVVSDVANTSTGAFDLPAGTVLQQPASPSVGMMRWNTTDNCLEAFNGNFWQAYTGSWGTYTKSVNTPTGGVQTCRYIFDEYGTWVLVGRFAASAKDTIQGVWSSVRGLSVSTAQDQATEFSADWGTATPSEVRILGATNFEKWRANRTVDWVYKVPSGRMWKHFFTSGNASALGTGGDIFGNGVRHGFACAGAYDGFGRWSNTGYSFMRMSDGAVTISSDAFSTPTSNAFNFNATGDAKLAVHHTLSASGQDSENTCSFGSDDDYDLFFDAYPNVVGAATYPVNFSSAVWVLIKVS
jgi:hypothetical protein